MGSRIFLIGIVTFALSADVAAGPTNLPLEWLPVAGAFSYQVVVTNDAGVVVLNQQSGTNALQTQLEPGNYVVRIAVINRFRKIASWSDPAALVVGATAPLPAVKKMEPQSVKAGLPETRVTLYGDNLSQSSQVSVSSEKTGSVIPVTKTTPAKDSLAVTLDTRDAKPGEYDMTIRNPLFPPEVKKNFLTVSSPDSAGKEPVKDEKKDSGAKSSEGFRICPGFWGSVCRSAILPGWGHYYAGYKKTAIVYPSLMLGAGVAAYTLQKTATAKKASYRNSARNDFTILTLTGHREAPTILYVFWVSRQNYNSYQNKQSVSNGAWPVIGGIYLVQLVHAAISGRMAGVTSIESTLAASSSSAWFLNATSESNTQTQMRSITYTTGMRLALP